MVSSRDYITIPFYVLFDQTVAQHNGHAFGSSCSSFVASSTSSKFYHFFRGVHYLVSRRTRTFLRYDFNFWIHQRLVNNKQVKVYIYIYFLQQNKNISGIIIKTWQLKKKFFFSGWLKLQSRLVSSFFALQF